MGNDGQMSGHSESYANDREQYFHMLTVHSRPFAICNARKFRSTIIVMRYPLASETIYRNIRTYQNAQDCLLLDTAAVRVAVHFDVYSFAREYRKSSRFFALLKDIFDGPADTSRFP